MAPILDLTKQPWKFQGSFASLQLWVSSGLEILPQWLDACGDAVVGRPWPFGQPYWPGRSCSCRPAGAGLQDGLMYCKIEHVQGTVHPKHLPISSRLTLKLGTP